MTNTLYEKGRKREIIARIVHEAYQVWEELINGKYVPEWENLSEAKKTAALLCVGLLQECLHSNPESYFDADHDLKTHLYLHTTNMMCTIFDMFLPGKEKDEVTE